MTEKLFCGRNCYKYVYYFSNYIQTNNANYDLFAITRKEIAFKIL